MIYSILDAIVWLSLSGALPSLRLAALELIVIATLFWVVNYA